MRRLGRKRRCPTEEPKNQKARIKDLLQEEEEEEKVYSTNIEISSKEKVTKVVGFFGQQLSIVNFSFSSFALLFLFTLCVCVCIHRKRGI